MRSDYMAKEESREQQERSKGESWDQTSRHSTPLPTNRMEGDSGYMRASGRFELSEPYPPSHAG